MNNLNFHVNEGDLTCLLGLAAAVKQWLYTEQQQQAAFQGYIYPLAFPDFYSAVSLPPNPFSFNG